MGLDHTLLGLKVKVTGQG